MMGHDGYVMGHGDRLHMEHHGREARHYDHVPSVHMVVGHSVLNYLFNKSAIQAVT